VVIKSGRHTASARAAASHTGALAGVDAVYDAAFRRAGLLRVDDLGQLFAAAETLSLVPRAAGKRVSVVTNGGGAGVLAVDRLVDLGGCLAPLTPETTAALDAALPSTWSKGNPIDIVGDAPPERYAAALSAVLNDPTTDSVVVMNCPTALASSRDAAKAVVETIRDYRRTHFRGKPVIAAWLGFDREAEAVFNEARIPVLNTPNRAVEGLMQLIRYAEAQEALTATPPDLLAGFTPDRARAKAAVDKALGDGRTWLTATEVADVLAACDLGHHRAVGGQDRLAGHRAQVGRRRRRTGADDARGGVDRDAADPGTRPRGAAGRPHRGRDAASHDRGAQGGGADRRRRGRPGVRADRRVRPRRHGGGGDQRQGAGPAAARREPRARPDRPHPRVPPARRLPRPQAGGSRAAGAQSASSSCRSWWPRSRGSARSTSTRSSPTTSAS
jgi:hypothetical protein